MLSVNTRFKASDPLQTVNNARTSFAFSTPADGPAARKEDDPPPRFLSASPIPGG